MFYHDTKGAEMTAHVDDPFVVGCLKDVHDVYHGLAGAFEMKCTVAGPKTGNSEVEYLGRRIVFPENGLEIHGDPKHAAILLKETGMEMCKSVSSHHVADTKLLDTLADDTRSYMAPTDASRHRSAVALAWSVWPKTVQILMLWHVLWRKRWRIPRLEMSGW